jgi:NADPH2:quinone reductase
LLARRGVRVLGIASAANAEWLTAHGVVPVTYGDGLSERLRSAAGEDGVAAFVDLYGPEYLDVAVELGVPRERINTIVPGPRVRELGVQGRGGAETSTPEILLGLAQLAAVGALDVPIAATYPLEKVADAFAELEQGHTRGKIVLIP